MDASAPLESLSYRELQALAKARGLRANQKRDALVQALLPGPVVSNVVVPIAAKEPVVHDLAVLVPRASNSAVDCVQTVVHDTTPPLPLVERPLATPQVKALSPSVIAHIGAATSPPPSSSAWNRVPATGCDDGSDGSAENVPHAARSPRGLALTSRGTLDWSRIRDNATTTASMLPRVAGVVQPRDGPTMLPKPPMQNKKRAVDADDPPRVRLAPHQVARLERLKKQRQEQQHQQQQQGTM